MKIKLPEHDHKLTNILKILLFSLLMLLPFLDIGTRCGYVLLNKNAYQSYYGETINEVNYEVVDQNNFKIGNEYRLLLDSTMNALNTSIAVDNVNVINFSTETVFNTLVANQDQITSIYFGANDCRFYVDDAILTRVALVNNVNGLIQFTYTNGTYLNEYATNMSLVSYNSYSYLDNVFDYSIDKMANSPLYNWTTQTGMYTGVNAMTTGLGITTPLFAILITYWMFLTIIYIILDIVLSLFTFMTHIFTKKE